MKKIFKLIGIIAFTAVIIFTMTAAACGKGGGGGSGGGKLTEGKWANGSVSQTGDVNITYSFNVTKDTYYYVWWNDSGDGDGNKTANIHVSQYFGTTESEPYSTASLGYSYDVAKKFEESGTVYLVVDYVYTPGTFAIVYNTTGERPE